MRHLYEIINNTLNNINFNEIWDGFSKTEFALYNKKNVYLDRKIIPYDTRFIANTTIEYEGQNLAIWFIEDSEDVSYEELSANIVHEMFHSYQKLQKESRFPDDIKALSYPNSLENYQLKYNENIMLVEALNSSEKDKKIDILMKIIASRKLRLKEFGDLIRYEFEIETIEGCAEYCGTKALEIISRDLYIKRIEKYKEILVSDKKMLFDIRRGCYFTGTLFLLLLDEIGIKFSKNILGEKLTVFDQILEKIDTNNIIINKPKLETMKISFEEELIRKENLINDFNSNNLTIHNGEFTICGYDPMNMFKIDNKIFCNNFIILHNIKIKENVFLAGPIIVIIEDNSEIIKEYYTIN